MRAMSTWLSVAAACFGCTSEPPTEDLTCSTPGDTAAADVTITTKDAVIQPAEGVSFIAWTYDGDVPGPVIRMNIGDTKRVKLVNESPRPASLHFHGVTYSDTDDGSPEHPESMVNPGCAHVYTITANQPGVWAYHSHRDPRVEMARGLHGAIVVPFPGEAAADHEYVVYMGQLGIEGEGGGGEAEEADEGGQEAAFFMTLNGRPNGDAEVIALEGGAYTVTTGAKAEARVGERVRWRVVNVSPDDPHTFHLHGHRWCDRGGVMDSGGGCPAGSLPVDNVDIFPAQGISFEFVEDNPGEWMYHCHIVDHVVDGMYAFYDVAR
jgi:FtsP/CotA-like multicopper oxidase with cupredoxin domain